VGQRDVDGRPSQRRPAVTKRVGLVPADWAVTSSSAVSSVAAHSFDGLRQRFSLYYSTPPSRSQGNFPLSSRSGWISARPFLIGAVRNQTLGSRCNLA
jgi:hypothetical protein